MQIKSSTTLRNDYGTISHLAHETRLAHHARILEAELSRLSGEATYTVEQARNRLKEKYSNAEIQMT